MGRLLKAAIAVFLLFSVSGCITFSDRSSARQGEPARVAADDQLGMDLLRLPGQLSGLALSYINFATDTVVDFIGKLLDRRGLSRQRMLAVSEVCALGVREEV